MEKFRFKFMVDGENGESLVYPGKSGCFALVNRVIDTTTGKECALAWNDSDFEYKLGKIIDDEELAIKIKELYVECYADEFKNGEWDYDKDMDAWDEWSCKELKERFLEEVNKKGLNPEMFEFTFAE